MNDYSDIINIKHHDPSPKHPRMSIYNRSAQFAPFSALTGYNKSIYESSRIVDKKIELDDSKKEMISDKLSELSINNKEVLVTYFIKDKYKNGGKYKKVSEKIKKIDKYNKRIILNNDEIILFDDIISIDNS